MTFTTAVEPGYLSPWHRLAAAAEVLGQERLGAGVEVDPVLRPGEAVALVGVDHVGDARRLFFSIASTICSDSACFTRGSFAPWPISSGRTDLVGLEQRRARP